MARSPIIRYSVPLLAVALALPLVWVLPIRGQGIAPLLLVAVTVSAWQGGLGPGLLATGSSALTLDLLLPPAYSPAASWTAGLRLTVFLAAAALLSSLCAQQRRLARALRRQDRRKDELLATLAHEIRSPVSAILNSLRLLHLPTSTATDRTWALSVVERQANTIARLATDLLDVSRIGLGKLRLCKVAVDVAEVVADAVAAARPLLDERQHRLEVSLPAAPVHLDADSTRLGQILVNLLDNAAKYTEPGGVIQLVVACAGDEVLLQVRDSGIGLSAEFLPRVFEPFVQAEDGAVGGLGLGLSLVRGLVEMHGGSVAAFSEGSGRGSTFVARFPHAREPVGHGSAVVHRVAGPSGEPAG